MSSPVKARRSIITSYSVQPAAQMSTLPSYACDMCTSGARYTGEPHCVCFCAPAMPARICFDSPRSPILSSLPRWRKRSARAPTPRGWVRWALASEARARVAGRRVALTRRLDVAVEDVHRVEEVEAGDELREPPLHLRLRKLLAVAHLALPLDPDRQVARVAIVHDDAELVALDEGLAEADEVRVARFGERAHRVHLALHALLVLRRQMAELLQLRHVCARLRGARGARFRHQHGVPELAAAHPRAGLVPPRAQLRAAGRRLEAEHRAHICCSCCRGGARANERRAADVSSSVYHEHVT